MKKVWAWAVVAHDVLCYSVIEKYPRASLWVGVALIVTAAVWW